MTDLLNTGKSALFAFQRALSTTSNNIANVHTDGYSRQRVSMEPVSGDHSNRNYIGAGVRVSDIERVHDLFATARVNSATSAHSEQEVQYSMASRLDNVVANEGMSVSPAINEFFNAIQDANNDASSLAAREVVLSSAEQLATRFQTMQAQLEDAHNDINSRTRAAVESVDELAQSIANINQEISSSGRLRQAQAANDLMDQRDRLVNELSTLIEVNTVEQENGALSIFIGKGIGLVVDGSHQNIKAVPDDIYPDRLQIQVGNEGSERNIGALLQGGEIGGLSAFASETLDPAKQQLGRLALVMAEKFNNQHSQGIDLDGTTGGDLFGTAEPLALSNDRNTGTGIMSVTIDDTNLLEPSDYLMRYDGANFTVTRGSDGVQSSGALPLTIDGLNLSITGTPAAGDTFVISATSRAASSFTAVLNDPENLALAGKLTTRSEIANLGDSRISPATVNDPDAVALTNPIDIVFSTDTTYDIVDVNTGTTLTAGVTYTEGDSVSLNGWEATLEGKARSGDIHRIEPNTTGLGNNSNGLGLSDMQLEAVIDESQSFTDAYGAMVSRIGAHTQSAESRTKALESLRSNAVDRQQSIQGVSLDEEAIDLTRYQQAYQASAQIIATADTLFQTILGALR